MRAQPAGFMKGERRNVKKNISFRNFKKFFVNFRFLEFSRNLFESVFLRRFIVICLHPPYSMFVIVLSTSKPAIE